METPLACGNGTYANTTGLTDCKTCLAGFYCADPDLTPMPCAYGYYSHPGAVYCLPCPAGHRYAK